MAPHPPRRARRIETLAAAITLSAAHVARAAFAGGGLATAAASSRAAAPVDAEARQVAIPAGTLADALAHFAAASGVQLVFEPALLGGLRTAGLQGRYTTRNGLEQLLRGSALEAVEQPAGGWIVRRAGPPAREAAAVAAPAAIASPAASQLVTIVGGALRETPTSHIDGYVARRSITATKVDTALIENPQSVSVVTADEMVDRQAETLDEALRYTAGVTPNLKPWAVDEFSLLRGFELGNAGIYLDGLLTSGRAYAAPIETYGLERLEVLRGPASVLFGQMPPGGMVDAVSKRPTAETQREIGVDYGTYARKQVKADFAGAFGDTREWRYGLTMLDRDAGTRLDHDRDDRLYIAPALTWRPDANTRLTLLGRYQKDDQSYVWPNQFQHPSADGQASPSVNIGGFDNRWRRDNKTLGYDIEHRFDDTWSVQQNLRYSVYDRSETNVFPLGLQDDGRTVTRVFWPRSSHWRGLLSDTHAQAHVATGPVAHTALFGVDYAKSRTTNDYPYARPVVAGLDLLAPVYTRFGPMPAASPYLDDIPSRQVGIYVQDQAKWNRWVVTAGVRHDKATSTDTRVRLLTGIRAVQSDVDASATTGRVGAVYLADAGWAPYANFATSFSPEIGTDVSGDALKPSKGRQVEAGLRYQPKGRDVNLTASVFDIVRSNVTTAAPGDPDNSVQTGQVRSRGLELEARSEFTRRLSVIAQYTLLDTRITRSNNGDQGLRQMAAPRHGASVWGKYTLPVGEASHAFAAMGVRHVGQARSALDNDNLGITNPGLTLVDAALGVDHEGWRVSINVNNLSNRQSLMDCDGTLCYRSAERTANVSALMHF